MKKFISLAMCLCLLLSTFTFVSLTASAETFGDFEYKLLSDGTIEISDYTGSAKTLEIPSEINGKKVTSIGDCAFKDCYLLTSIKIPDSVTSIGSSAFNLCKSLTNITIPDSVISIDVQAFYHCTSLTSVTIPGSVTSIDRHTFDNCTSLTSVTIPDSVTSIGIGAFDNCTSLTSVTIPDSVTSIGIGAFYYCTSLTSVTIPDSVTCIGEDVFKCCYSLTGVTIPDSVTSIEKNAFNKCKSLSNMTIPDSVTSIGEGAFSGCVKLSNVRLSKELVDLGIQVFTGCSELTKIEIPKSLKTIIGSYAFAGPFSNCTNLKTVTFEEGTTEVIRKLFYDCEGLETIIIPDSVTSIGNEAFNKCTSLTSVTIPDSVTSIGERAFYDCTSLTSITIPDSVTSIDSSAVGRKVKIYCCINSEAYNYAVMHKNDYEIICKNGKEHDFVDSIKSPTCVDKGYTIHKCSVCGYEYNDNYTKTVEHTAGKIIEKIEPTCIKKGYITYECSVCGDSFTEILSATGHEEEILPAKSATCTEAGLTEGKKCSVCGVILVKQAEIAALGHSYDNGDVIKQPTCEEDGVKTFTCTVCDNKKTETIPALGHSYDNGVVTIQPTCIETGVKTFTCTVCDDSYIETIPALGHKEEVIPAKSATCTKTGLTEGKKCSVCGEVLVEQTEIPALGHSYDNGVITKQPTCVNEGIKTFTCKACGEIKTEKIAKTAHNFKVYTTKATYFASGKTVYKCDCGKVQRTVIIKKLTLKAPKVSVKAGKKKFTVKYTKVKGATGFVVKYKMGKKWITKKFKTAKSATKTISKLKKGKYKVQIRAYKRSGKSYAYSKTVTKTVIVK